MINLPEYYSSIQIAMSDDVDSNTALFLYNSRAGGFEFDDGLFTSLAEVDKIGVSSSLLCD